MIKLEQIKSFLGFGTKKPGSYYFSSGMHHKDGGIEPGWKILKQADSSTAGVLYMGYPQGFTERDQAGTPYIYMNDDVGDTFSVADQSTDWARVHKPGTTSHGNGIITDHSGSQRILYIQDEYVGSYDGTVWYDTFMDLGWSLNIKKEADLYEDWVVIPNGSTVALLNITDDSKDYDAFVLPRLFKCIIAKSGKNGVLLGANYNNKGVLILWGKTTDAAWASRSIAPWIWTDKIRGIAKYNGIWIVSTGREYLLTDGYNILRKYEPPDLTCCQYNFGPELPTGMLVEGDELFVSSEIGFPNRQKSGVWILNLITGLWEYCPPHTFNTWTNFYMGALFKSSLGSKYVSYQDGFISAGQNTIGRIYGAANSSYFIMEVGDKSDKKKRAEGILLNFSYPPMWYKTYPNPNWKITAKLYNFTRVLWVYGQAASTSSSAIDIPINGLVFGTDGGYNKAEVGDEITVLEGANAGSIRHIAVIVRAGQANEIWTLDRPLNSVIEAGATVNVSPFKKVGEKTLTTAQIKDDRVFIPIQTPIIGRKFLLKIVIDPTYIDQKPHITGVSFIYDEL